MRQLHIVLDLRGRQKALIPDTIPKKSIINKLTVTTKRKTTSAATYQAGPSLLFLHHFVHVKSSKSRALVLCKQWRVLLIKYQERINQIKTLDWENHWKEDIQIFHKKCNLTLAVSPTCPQHKPSAYLLAAFPITSQLRIGIRAHRATCTGRLKNWTVSADKWLKSLICRSSTPREQGPGTGDAYIEESAFISLLENLWLNCKKCGWHDPQLTMHFLWAAKPIPFLE